MVWLTGILRRRSTATEIENVESSPLPEQTKRASRKSQVWQILRPSVKSSKVSMRSSRVSVASDKMWEARKSFNSNTWSRIFYPKYHLVAPAPVCPPLDLTAGCDLTEDPLEDAPEEVLATLRYVQSRLDSREKVVGITRFEFIQRMALAPKAPRDIRACNVMYRSAHSYVHPLCGSTSTCRITSDDFDAFYARHKKERHYRELVATFLPGENVPMTEGLIRAVEQRAEWPGMLELLADCCLDVRPLSTFAVLVRNNGLTRIWNSVKLDLEPQGDDDEARRAGRFEKLQAWWTFLYRTLKDAFAANIPGETIDAGNLFYDPLTGEVRDGGVPANEVLEHVWQLYHPKNILYVIGEAANANDENMETLVRSGWRLLGVGAVEFLAEKRVGGLARLRPILANLASIRRDFDISAVETYKQLESIVHTVSKLDSILKADPTFCLAAAMHGVPFFLELIEWWIRQCASIIVSPDAMSLAGSIIKSLQRNYDKLENYVYFVYQGVDAPDESAAAKAKTAHYELHKGREKVQKVVTNVVRQLKLATLQKTEPRIPQAREQSDAMSKAAPKQKLAPRHSVEIEQAWYLLLQSLTDDTQETRRMSFRKKRSKILHAA